MRPSLSMPIHTTRWRAPLDNSQVLHSYQSWFKLRFNHLSRVACILLLSLVTACSQQPRELYYWGGYEQLLYEMYAKPGSADPLTQIEILTANIQRANNKDHKVAPGIYAHLGMMYAALGNASESQAALTMEKTLYPEASVLIDGLLQRAQQNSEQAENNE